jgi:nanoRNase/pAp phosphatase (c-di-AMP/oligoRNAs hydrolase)
MIYVIYHAECSDGFCAAWLFHMAYPNATFIPANYGQPLPVIEDGSRVFILDFSYPRGVMVALAERCKVLVLDHHKTAAANCEGLEFCIFDQSRSGARMAYDWLMTNHLAFEDGGKIEMLVNYVQDRDLWQHQMVDTHTINACIRSIDFDFDAWDELLGHSIYSLITEGTAILRYRSKLIAEHVARAAAEMLDGHLVYQVACTVKELVSDIGGELAAKGEFGVVYSDHNGYRTYSLRSRNGFDVSAVAAKFGGGGHAAAAGYKVKL